MVIINICLIFAFENNTLNRRNMNNLNENKSERFTKGNSNFWDKVKHLFVNTVTITILVTVMLKDCSAHDLIADKVIPTLDSISLRQMEYDKVQSNILNKVSEASTILSKVTIDLGKIKEKYIHPEKQGIVCEVRQSKFINDNEIGIYPDNEYKLKSGMRILVMNTNSASNPMMTLTVTTDVKVDNTESNNHFFLNKDMFRQLGIDTQKNRRGVYNLRFFNIE